jgi:hypothetical protein
VSDEVSGTTRSGTEWNPARRALVAGLVLGAVGLTCAWLASEQPRSFPPGVPMLLAAAAIAALPTARAAGLAGLVAAGLVGGRLLAGDQGDELLFGQGAALAGARWLQALGLLVAAVSALTLILRRPTPGANHRRRAADPVARRERRARAAQVAGLLVLSAIGAELLSAYDDSTGRPFELLFAVVFFAALYGAPALLIRELARRNGWGWPSIVMLAFALGILQPAVIDQALFSADYRNIEGWDESLRATFIEPLGFSATNAVNFVLGHVIYSFCAPIAVAEAWRPATASTPWLGLPGVAVAAVLYLLAAVLVLQDPESHSASAAQLAGSLAAAGLCVGAAAWVGRRAHGRRQARQAPRVWVTVAGSFLLLTAASSVPGTWTGVAFATAVLTAGAALLVHASRSIDWSVRHTAAVATGALLSRGAAAFFYYPVVGEITAVRKYAHNVTMLAVVVVLGWLALRVRGPAADTPAAAPPSEPRRALRRG